MKNFFTLALVASLAVAQIPFPPGLEDPPEEPDNDFPDEWDNEPDCDADINSRTSRKPECIQPDRQVEEIIQYDTPMAQEYKKCKDDQFCKPRRAYCKMQHNPAYPTSYPYGFINLWQFTPAAPVYLWGYMKNLPVPNPSAHGFSINSKYFNGKDCASCGPILQTAGQTHKWPNAAGGFIGDLWPLYTNSLGNDNFWWTVANAPSMWGPSSTRILYKSMVAYEKGDDFGFGGTFASAWNGSACKEVACCTIRPHWIQWDHEIEKEEIKPRGRGLQDLVDEIGEDIDVFTPEEYVELFGHEPERFASEMEFDLN